MRWLAHTVMLAYLAASLVYLPVAHAASDTPIESQSSSLTDYLHKHRLPLVGAQVTVDSYGARQLMLYGFTATEFGKEDAEAKSRRFLHDPDLRITNRIMIRPELANMKTPHAAATAQAQARSTAPASSDINSYLNQQARDQQQYLQQQQNQYVNQGTGTAGTLTSLLPLLGLGAAIIGLGVGGGTTFGGVGTYGGYGVPMNNYGYPGYNQYPGYSQYPGVAPYTAPAPYPGYGTPYGTYP